MTYLTEVEEKTGLWHSELVKEKGLELRQQYLAAQPFPHVAIDDFLPTALLDRCLMDFPSARSAEETFDRDQERLKRSFSPDRLPSSSRQLFYSFNSRPFIQIIENITGIKGLIPDPYFLGGGFHEISQGGHLSVHADFNHHIPMNLERRINVLIYLNRNWRDEYGSQLELWDVSMTQCIKSYLPLFNRCVIFNTTSLSNHGNPKPVQHPDGVPRRSIALYYYTATWDSTKRTQTTQFRVRPESEDQPDHEVRVRELLADWIPPALYRELVRFRRRRQRRHSK
jgi:Rps23 Pro-64 3,4-dihydroxylase Tpa1-like proline 4-hydroxylase